MNRPQTLTKVINEIADGRDEVRRLQIELDRIEEEKRQILAEIAEIEGE